MSKKLSILLALLLLALAASPAALAAPDANFNATGYPIVQEPITLSIMGPRNAAVFSSWSENRVFQYMEELTNIRFNYLDVDSNAWTEKLNLAFASGDLPDILTKTSISNQMLITNLEQGFILPLNDLIEQYAPNAKAAMERNPALETLITLPGGVIGGLFTETLACSTESPLVPTTNFLLYQPWLDALGLDMPTNTQELYDVLKAFKEGDPNGNGKADEIPLSPLYGQSGLRDMMAFFGLPGGNSVNFCELDKETGKVVFLALEPEYKDFLAYCKTLYAEGLLDNDVFTQNQQQVVAKGTDQDPLIGASIASASFLVVGDSRAQEMVTAPIIESPNGEKIWYRRPAGNAGTFVLTSLNKHPEASIRWADFFYTEEGARFSWMGIEGEAWEWNADGTWSFILPEGTNQSQLRGYATLQPGGGNPCAFPTAWLSISDTSESFATQQRALYLNDDPENQLVLAFPVVFYSDADQKQVATYATDVNSYVNQMMARFITGESNLETEWDAYEQTLKRMGLEDMVRIMQAACDAL